MIRMSPLVLCLAAALPQEGDLSARLDRRIQELQPRPEERKFDLIGWLKDIRGAEELARKHGRPVFLFTHDGRMATGRC